MEKEFNTLNIPEDLVKEIIRTLDDAINCPVTFSHDYAKMVKRSTGYKNRAMQYVVKHLVELYPNLSIKKRPI